MKQNSIFIFSALIFITKSCNGQDNKLQISEQKTSKIEKMDLKEEPSFESQIVFLKKSMIEYMETANPSYSKNDVEECGKILTNYLSEISNSKSKEDGMNIVKNIVEKLNKLNEKCNFELIETSEREQIVEIIILSSSKKGYNKPEEDLTENWREW
ncbi:hypothetical protein [Chryseobacterium sp. ISL-6]|uniref:hypothetical protein n=1 Tax=Chryseobacterium sp. ISL-6 TaxID=2819143 RepID=UPI001BE79ADD|nr:hypothetical protein [Chryseobacterium sp. ISL-6]MBT2620359.1 hypothetical protein [Chryseobacterium sp. ISL-6]